LLIKHRYPDTEAKAKEFYKRSMAALSDNAWAACVFLLLISINMIQRNLAVL